MVGDGDVVSDLDGECDVKTPTHSLTHSLNSTFLMCLLVLSSLRFCGPLVLTRKRVIWEDWTGTTEVSE
jgi:hypothetical protein